MSKKQASFLFLFLSPLYSSSTYSPFRVTRKKGITQPPILDPRANYDFFPDDMCPQHHCDLLQYALLLPPPPLPPRFFFFMFCSYSFSSSSSSMKPFFQGFSIPYIFLHIWVLSNQYKAR
ncbi:hypothetical protein QBC42DRAFT_22250 [Cladorrhinum samala]|uniref:Uncharacterized protein n=1 Tax=Cladorrhinum samala TaxID=585594 RepID=A0AAV9HWI3_9PEZI|nr:hypothetical protein QBC42DRAFT_22250 [Cladorrhinum samala]